MSEKGTINMLSIDVEDYFHVSAFEDVCPVDGWCQYELRVEQNTEKILNILDRQSTKATFFILGWVAEKCPGMVKSIAEAGHEVASHGYSHRRLCQQDRHEFRADIRKAKDLLEDLIGEVVLGYRAPSYSISPLTWWAFDEIKDAGYCYDSSVFPIVHDFYGMPDWSRFAGSAVRQDDGRWQPTEVSGINQKSLFEVPITTLPFAGKKLPIGGGGYFRLYPYKFTRWGLQRINKVDVQPFVFYLHPWELDPAQPRIKGAGWKARVRHYLNLKHTETRFETLLHDFAFSPIREFLPAPHTDITVLMNREEGREDADARVANYL